MALNKGLKLIKQIIRVFECILETHFRQRVEIDQMQCRCMSGHGDSTVEIFILSQLQKLLLTSNKPFYITFINIEKDSRYVVCMPLYQRVAGATDALQDQEHGKQGIVREPAILLIKWLRPKGLKVCSYVEKYAEFKN